MTRSKPPPTHRRPGMIWTLTGAPGSGKTRLALAFAAHRAKTSPTLVLHTDLLKVTLRQMGVSALRGPGWADPARAMRARPLLAAHAEKADRDGYDLIIEGTLATGFDWPGAAYVVLEISSSTRTERIAQKHASAQAALCGVDLAGVEQALAAHAPPSATRLDAEASIVALVEQLERLRYTERARRS
ncbi:MAG: zeta toxin family protein [Myxococcota bacterium]